VVVQTADVQQQVIQQQQQQPHKQQLHDAAMAGNMATALQC
jgi:hypothetical protein